jgi:hypothetical protein
VRRPDDRGLLSLDDVQLITTVGPISLRVSLEAVLRISRSRFNFLLDELEFPSISGSVK